MNRALHLSRNVDLFWLFVLFMIFCCTVNLSVAAVDPVTFDNEILEQRYRVLTQTLRCPKCQNQSIAGSDAPIAKDMRDRVAELLREGQSDQAIEQFMIDRYGEFVTYKPPVKPRTYVLWFAPPFFLALISFGFWMAYRRRSATSVETTADDAQRENL